MTTTNEKDTLLKQKFVTLCSAIEVSDGKLILDFNDLKFNPTVSSLLEDDDFTTLKTKAKKLLKLVNEDKSLFSKDIETELWYMV